MEYSYQCFVSGEKKKCCIESDTSEFESHLPFSCLWTSSLWSSSLHAVTEFIHTVKESQRLFFSIKVSLEVISELGRFTVYAFLS